MKPTDEASEGERSHARFASPANLSLLQPPHQRLGREVGREGERKKSALHVRWQSLRNCFESSRRASSPLLNTLAMNFGKANT